MHVCDSAALQGAAWIHFAVSAVARYVEPSSRHGTVVVLYTMVGDLTLDGDAMIFSERIGGICIK